MTHGGFRAAPADLAAAAPRLSEAADGLCAELGETERALADHGPFWGVDGEFAYAYLRDAVAAVELAAGCASTLRALARRLAEAAAAYAEAEYAAADGFLAVDRLRSALAGERR